MARYQRAAIFTTVMTAAATTVNAGIINEIGDAAGGPVSGQAMSGFSIVDSILTNVGNQTSGASDFDNYLGTFNNSVLSFGMSTMSNQPFSVYFFDANRHALGGYHNYSQDPFSTNINVGAGNIGQVARILFTDVGSVPLDQFNNPMFDIGQEGTVSPIVGFSSVWTSNQTNNFTNAGSLQVDFYNNSLATSVPGPGVLGVVAASAFVVAGRRCRVPAPGVVAPLGAAGLLFATRRGREKSN